MGCNHDKDSCCFRGEPGHLEKLIPKAKKITDKERLDFIEETNSEVQKDSSPYAGDEVWFVGDEGGWYPTLRAAIDAAIRASRTRRSNK